MRLSRYVKSKAVEPDVVGLYSPFGHEFTFVSGQDWQLLKDGLIERVTPVVASDLVRRRFVVNEGFEDTVLDAYRPPDEGIREMWLVLAQSCNMSCHYCVVEGNVKDPNRRIVGKRPSHVAHEADRTVTLPVLTSASTSSGSCCSGSSRRDPDQSTEHADFMTPEVAEAAVRHFQRYLCTTRPPYPRVTLYGGEPLLNIKTVSHVIPVIREVTFPGQIRPEPVQILVITNGQIYSDKLSDMFVKYRVCVSVSVDGLRHHHDAQRVLPDGSGTWDKAVETLKRYKQRGIQVGICTTIGSHNVSDLPDIAEYFADEFGVQVEFQVPFDFQFDGGSPSYIPMMDAAPKAMEAYERLRARGMIEGLAARRLLQVARGIFHHRDCSAVGGQWVVAPDGMIGPCHSLVGERTFFGSNVLDPDCDPSKLATFQEWGKRVPVNMPDCHGCSAIAICGGGCPYNALIRRGSIWAKDPQQCEYMDYMLDWMIQDSWKRYRSASAGTSPNRGQKPRAVVGASS